VPGAPDAAGWGSLEADVGCASSGGVPIVVKGATSSSRRRAAVVLQQCTGPTPAAHACSAASDL
jgi:hypothetical protein